LITGVSRSGTTLLGKILSSFESVEYEFEPWLLVDLFVFRNSGLISRGAGRELLRLYLDEIMANHIMCRNVNLRSTDESRKDIPKSMREIRKRWKEIRNMDDVRSFVRKNRSVLTVKCPDLLPFLDDVYETIPGVKVMHIVRNPFDTALSIEKKKWVADDYMKMNRTPLRKRVPGGKKERFYPWWLKKKDADRFIRYNEYGRSLMFWMSQMEDFLRIKSGSDVFCEGNYLEVKYEDLLRNPDAVMRALKRFTGRKLSSKTDDFVKGIRRDNLKKNNDYRLEEVMPSDLKKIRGLLKSLGYGTESENLRGKCF